MICKDWCIAVVRRALLVIEAVRYVERVLSSETDDVEVINKPAGSPGSQRSSSVKWGFCPIGL